MRPFFFRGILSLLTGLLLLGSCTQKEAKTEALELLVIEEEGLHVETPYFFESPDGRLFMSWLAHQPGEARLMYSEISADGYVEKKLVATGKDWFLNWADYPRMGFFRDGSMIAMYLEKTGPGTFAYAIRYRISEDGLNWSEPKTLHDDDTETEHGFISLSQWGDEIFVSWLDGRNTLSASQHHAEHGAMNLRAAKINSKGEKTAEWLLDERVCDCCQTDNVVGPKGPIVVYRDRSEEEIRDIAIKIYKEGGWLEESILFPDFWEIAACPVNGPSIAMKENSVAVGWFQASSGMPTVKLKFSTNQGKEFAEPIRIDSGNPIGRVSVVMINPNLAAISWMESNGIWARTVSSAGIKSPPQLLVATSEKRSSGFPQLFLSKEQLWLSYTDDSGEFKKINFKPISLKKD